MELENIKALIKEVEALTNANDAESGYCKQKEAAADVQNWEEAARLKLLQDQEYNKVIHSINKLKEQIQPCQTEIKTI